MIARDSTDVPFAVEGLVVAYRAEPVIWDLSWSARPGATSAIVGPNGAGKSTLLNAAIGLIPTVRGQARFWGQPFSEVRNRVAYVPQRETVDWDFPISALEVVQMGVTRGASWLLPDVLPSWARRIFTPSSRDGAAARSLAALQRVRMEEFAHRPIGELSGGQQQRVFLARALAQEADLYLLDEPFAGIDAATEALLTRELRTLAQDGKTVIAVHHDLDDVAERFDEVLVMNRERIAAGPAAETLTKDTIRRAFTERVPTEALFVDGDSQRNSQRASARNSEKSSPQDSQEQDAGTASQ